MLPTVDVSSLSQYSVRNSEEIWGVDRSEKIWVWKGEWARVDGALVYVSVAPDGTVYGLDNSHQIFRFVPPNSWTLVSGLLKQITVKDANEFWGIDTAGKVVRWTSRNGFEPTKPNLLFFRIEPNGFVWGQDSEQHRWGFDPSGNWKSFN